MNFSITRYIHGHPIEESSLNSCQIKDPIILAIVRQSLERSRGQKDKKELL